MYTYVDVAIDVDMLYGLMKVTFEIPVSFQPYCALWEASLRATVRAPLSRGAGGRPTPSRDEKDAE